MENLKQEGMREEEAKKIIQGTQENYNLFKISELLKDNKIEFSFNKQDYRVRLLTIKERDELEDLRKKEFGRLLQDRNILSISELIKLYKERGMVDIEEINSKITKLIKIKEDSQYKLGEALSKSEGDAILNKYEEEIKDINLQIIVLETQKNDYLEFSLENHLQLYVYKLIAWLSLERKDGENWIKAFDNLEVFVGADEQLVEKAIIYSGYIQLMK